MKVISMDTQIHLYYVGKYLFGFTVINKSLNRKSRKVRLTKVFKKYINLKKYIKKTNTNRGQSIDMLIMPVKKKVKYL